MAAYLIYRARVDDAEAYAAYMARTPGIIAEFSGKFLARGGRTETLEGEREERRTIIVEFPDFAAAKAFYDSPIYAEVRDLRANVADVQIVITDGEPGETGL
ncbi:MAG: DUF1330 domain-containing protein [Gammaproteobacteria bacterium]|nr:MAG: DUF1330 domain-containing protein [Gammaproteobacteria bacterium]RLA14073.1 MAG: DUF1330 domain-containing protein [Gammaproteobacteria bacterium]